MEITYYLRHPLSYRSLKILPHLRLLRKVATNDDTCHAVAQQSKLLTAVLEIDVLRHPKQSVAWDTCSCTDFEALWVTFTFPWKWLSLYFRYTYGIMQNIEVHYQLLVFRNAVQAVYPHFEGILCAIHEVCLARYWNYHQMYPKTAIDMSSCLSAEMYEKFHSPLASIPQKKTQQRMSTHRICISNHVYCQRTVTIHKKGSVQL